ncbi:MAG TPA: ABC transporter permease [Nitrolancea sp.]|nr:ABC transporter permease [Nitrolancea sp.]
MPTIFVIMLKDLKQFVNDRRALAMSLLIPFFLMLIIGGVFGTFSDSGSTSKIDTPIFVEDQGPITQQLLTALQQMPNLNLETKTSAADARKPVEDGDRSAAIIIPAGVSAAIEQGNAAKITVITSPSSQDFRAVVVQSVVDNVIQNFTAARIAGTVAADAVQANGGTADPATVASQASQQAAQQLSQRPLLTIETQKATQTTHDSSYNQVVPGYAIMFALFAVGGGIESILAEKEAGVWKRLLIAPVSRWALLGGKLLANFLIGVVQITLLFVAGRVFFGINVGSLPGVALLIIVTALATTALGMLLVSVVKTRKQLQPITTIVVLSFSALGGSWWPLFLMPNWLQQLSKVTLNGWAMIGFNNLMIFDKGFMSVVPSLFALVAYSAICFALAIRVFRFQEAS